MNTGAWLTLFLVASLTIFAIWDVWAYVTGRTTMSRWVIKMSKKVTWIGYIFLIFSTGITLVGFWLLFHWELPCILFNRFCNQN